jgi:FkbM family methyltransferase
MSGFARRIAQELVFGVWRGVDRLPVRLATARLFTGAQLRVVLPELIACDLWLDGRIEHELTRLVSRSLRSGMTFVDAGAHYGYYSVVAADAVGPYGHVYAFEPNPTTYDLLRGNVARFMQVRCERAALHSRSGEMTLRDFGPRHSSLATLLEEARVPARERRALRPTDVRIRTLTLDDYMAKERRRVHVLKIDAEGSELEILRGAERVLAEDRPLVTLETGDYDVPGCSPSADGIDFLERRGYRALDLDGGRLVPHRRRRRYGYGNLVFSADAAAPSAAWREERVA